MREFGYYTPGTVPEAIELLVDHGDGAKLLAGGTDLLLQMRAGQLDVDALVSVKQLDSLKGIEYTSHEGLRIGASVTLRDLTRSQIIKVKYPCLVETCTLMASEQVRSLATIGGNLCNASPAADLAPPLMALGASANIAGPAGERRLALQDFFLGPGDSALAPGELLVDLSLPAPRGDTVYLKHSTRAHMDIAVVGVAANVDFAPNREIQAARIVLGAVAPVPIRAREAEQILIGQTMNGALIEKAAAIAADESSPISDIRGSDWYRKRMITVLVRRSLQALSHTA
jgi:carbon-monoxide dehydrogenase medium subunit